MNQAENSNLDIAVLMDKVRDEVEQRRFIVEPISIDKNFADMPIFETRERYILDDFLKYQYEEFVLNAYLGILGREVDPQGLDTFLVALQENSLSKIQILGVLRFSKEGRMRKVKITGLIQAYFVKRLYGVPILGYFVQLVHSILQLPVLLDHHQQFENHVRYREGKNRLIQNNLAISVENSILKSQQRTQEKVRVIFDELSTKVGSDEYEQSMAQLNEVLTTKAELSALNEIAASSLTKATSRELKSLEENINEVLQHKAEKNDLELLETSVDEHLSVKAEELGALTRSLQDELATVSRSDDLHQLADKITGQMLQKADSEIVSSTLNIIQTLLDEMKTQVLGQKRNILDQERRLRAFLEESNGLLPNQARAESAVHNFSEEDHLLDAFYVDFEDRFRGSRDDIKSRLNPYVEIVKDSGAGLTARPILDIGCGRGEWLELLGEHNLTVSGLDLNRVMIDQCTTHELNVVEADALTYLRKSESNSLGAITGFHIIEHLPFHQLICIFDEALRVLLPGGLVIFETPNPENLTVGACSFYTDPTHLNPLPPTVTEFVAEARGFVNPRIKRMNQELLPNPFTSLNLEGSGSGFSEVVKDIIESSLFVAPDYSIIAYKPT